MLSQPSCEKLGTFILCFSSAYHGITSFSSSHCAFHRRAPRLRCSAFDTVFLLRRGSVQSLFTSIQANARKKPPSRPEKSHDWGSLIDEFEARADKNTLQCEPPPPEAIIEEDDPKRYEMFPIVETAAMASLTATMWFLGRMFRLDSFIMLFYPLPIFYSTLRWGPLRGDRTLIVSVLLLLGTMGPLYSIFFFLNTGILSFVFIRALWYQWDWPLAFIAGGFGKFVGLVLQVSWFSAMFRYNSWKLINEQVRALAVFFFGLFCRFLRLKNVPSPTIRQVQVFVVCFVAFHSIVHVIFTYLVSTMILDRIGDYVDFQRRAPLLPFLRQLKEKAKDKSLW